MFEPYRISERSSSVPSPSLISLSFFDEVREHLHVIAVQRAYCAIGPGPRAWCEPPWKLMSVPLSGYTRPVRSRA